MDNNSENSSNKDIENDYAAHENNPGPSREAVEEKDDSSVGSTMKWVIIIVVVALLIAWFFLKGE